MAVGVFPSRTPLPTATRNVFGGCPKNDGSDRTLAPTQGMAGTGQNSPFAGGAFPRPHLGVKRTKLGPKRTSPETLSPPPKKIQILAGGKSLGPLIQTAGGAGFFLQDAGADARTGEVSISSSRRATAGVRMSIGVDLTPFFRLNAVWAIRGCQGAP